MSSSRIALFSGNANLPLAQKISDILGVPLGKANVGRFSDGEIAISINDHVRGKDIYIIQPLSNPTNDHLMEMLLMGDALHRSSADRITAVIPYYGYARQDRRTRSERLPISARVLANLIGTCHFSRVLTVDLHAEQIQGFFDIPVDNIYAANLMIEDIKAHYNDEPICIVSPDVGGVQRARAVAKPLQSTLAIVDKRRPRPNEAEIMNVIGDVEGRLAIIIDDMIDTAGTMAHVSHALMKKGAKGVIAYATHAVLSGNALKNLDQSAFTELVVTNTIALSNEAASHPKIRQISLANVLAECIRRTSNGESISAIFK